MRRSRRFLAGAMAAAMLLAYMPDCGIVYAEEENENNTVTEEQLENQNENQSENQTANLTDLQTENYVENQTEDVIVSNTDTNLVLMDASTTTVTASGKCGDNITWSLDSAGTLTLSGSGVMDSYTKDSTSNHTKAPYGDYYESISKVVIEDGVETIGNYAFAGCSNIKEISIPNSVVKIGEDAFNYCTSLTSVNIPNSVTSIGFAAFSFSGLTNITIPSSVISIGQSVFYKCEGLTNVVISDGVSNISCSEFCGCSGLTSITIPNSVTSIESSAFQESGLVNVVIQNGVTSIEGRAFDGCDSLINITIPDSVTSIGARAFDGCSSLTSISIPNSVTSIGGGAFKNCNSLKSVTLTNIQVEIGSKAFGYYDSGVMGAKISGFVLWGKAGSTAETYATEYEIRFKDITCKISYELDGGTNAGTNPEKYDKGSVIVLDDPAKEGYRFLGWYTDPEYQNKMTSITADTEGDITLYAEWEYVYSLLGYRMTIDSDFNLKYYLKAGNGVIGSSSSYMMFVIGEGENASTVTSKISTSSSNGTVMYICEVPAKQIGDTISAYLVYEGKEYLVSEYSAEEYLNTVIANPNNDPEYDLASDLAKSILEYAAYSQIYFGYETDALVADVDSGKVAALTDGAVTKAITTELKGTTGNTDFSYYGASLVCSSELHLKIYLENKNGLTLDEINSKYEFTVAGDGAEDIVVGLAADGALTYVEIDGIPSYSLSDYYCIDTDQLDIVYSPFTYIKAAMASDDANLKNLCKALYLYNLEAAEYYTGKAL